MSDSFDVNSYKNFENLNLEELLMGFLNGGLSDKDKSQFTPEQLKIIRNVSYGIGIAHCYNPRQILEMHELYEKLKNERTDNNEGKEEAILRHQLNMSCPEDTNPYKDNDRKKIPNVGLKIFISDKYSSPIDNILPMNDFSHL
jgi:hypothetical protein